MRWLAALAVFIGVCAGAPIVEDGLTYHSHQARAEKLPTIKFPYGTWQASRYDAKADYYVFKNIRFAAAPIGELRFAKPAPPVPVTELQTGVKGGTCPQTIPKGMLGNNSLAQGAQAALGMFDVGAIMGDGIKSSEDCLFLDLYVPGKALKKQVKLPVINWIYGGAYVLGAKGAIYAGDGIVKASGGNVIFVSANYRLGPWGFMAGSTMEKGAVSNAGLWDQRTVLEWIQQNGELFGADVNDVSAWGESAGAGSIMNHLVAFGGKKPALFKKAMIQSPAFDVYTDRKGSLEEVYKAFEKAAGCAGKGLSCLRALSSDQMVKANAKFFAGLPEGAFGFGPAVDGVLIRQTPSLELASGNFQKEVESLIVSHVRDEAGMFVRNNVPDDGAFRKFVEAKFGNYSSITEAILKKYVSPDQSQGRYKDMMSRTKDVMEKSVFTCNTRYLLEAYGSKAWGVQYSRGSGGHGQDISPTFFNAESLASSVQSFTNAKDVKMSKAYQSYLISHARTGDPNKLRIKDSTIEWPMVDVKPQIGNVLDVTDKGFALVQDQKNTLEDCGFWRDVYAGLTLAGGYAPPDDLVKSPLFEAAPEAASKNFGTGCSRAVLKSAGVFASRVRGTI